MGARPTCLKIVTDETRIRSGATGARRSTARVGRTFRNSPWGIAALAVVLLFFPVLAGSSGCWPDTR